jgi:chromosome segregation ATPase
MFGSKALRIASLEQEVARITAGYHDLRVNNNELGKAGNRYKEQVQNQAHIISELQRDVFTHRDELSDRANRHANQVRILEGAIKKGAEEVAAGLRTIQGSTDVILKLQDERLQDKALIDNLVDENDELKDELEEIKGHGAAMLDELKADMDSARNEINAAGLALNAVSEFIGKSKGLTKKRTEAIYDRFDVIGLHLQNAVSTVGDVADGIEQGQELAAQQDGEDGPIYVGLDPAQPDADFTSLFTTRKNSEGQDVIEFNFK